MQVESIITDIFKKSNRAKSTLELDLSTNTNAIFKTTYNELEHTHPFPTYNTPIFKQK